MFLWSINTWKGEAAPSSASIALRLGYSPAVHEYTRNSFFQQERGIWKTKHRGAVYCHPANSGTGWPLPQNWRYQLEQYIVSVDQGE